MFAQNLFDLLEIGNAPQVSTLSAYSSIQFQFILGISRIDLDVSRQA